MRIFVAGATGAMGVPLVKRLVAAGHQVTGLTRSEAKRSLLEGLGATAAVADVFDRERLVSPYAVISLTSRFPVSNAKARRELGWRPAYPTYREGLATLVPGKG